MQSLFYRFNQNKLVHNKLQILLLNCDEPEVIQMLSQINSAELKLLIGHHWIVVIDEAQRLLAMGLSAEQVAKATQLSLEIIKNLSNS